MSFAEYSQLAEDHASLLILIKQVGSCLTPKSFSKMFDRITRLRTLKVANPPRVISLRYKRYYTIENNAWGTFQAHRKVLGLISIGKCENENDATELCHLHEDLKEQYEGTLLDSRLILFGSCFGLENQDCEQETINNYPDSNDNICQEESVTFKIDSKDFKDPLNVNGSSGVDGDLAEDQDDDQDSPEDLQLNSETQTNSQDRKNRELTGSHVLHFYSEDECPNLEEHLQEFLSSLFWVLESKRLDRSNERLDHPTLITAPFERKDSSSSDSDSRLYRKRCQGRLKKHLADLCLLSGVCGEAVLHYRTSLEMLKAANDVLWLAGAHEGLAIALYMDLKGRSVSSQGMARYPSFSFKPGLSRLKESKLRPSLRIMTSSVRNGLDLADNNSSSVSATLPNDVLESYKEAVISYSKFPDAGIVEMEASLKACRILIAHQRVLEAADFLQNVVTINLELMEEEKIQRFITLSMLYSALNMNRKAAFYSRVAAMHCVAPSNPKPAWSQCYNLLVKSLSGYKLSLDPKEIPQGGPNGWSAVQLRVIHELVYTARRMGNASIAIRHLSFLLHTMFDYLRNDECTELAGVLKSYTSKCDGVQQSIALEDGTIVPPVVLFRFPTVRSFRLLKLMPHCRPVHFKTDSLVTAPELSVSSPFIYSPLTLTTSTSEKSSNPEQYYWVEGETSEVELQLHNPLPFELIIDGLGLMTEGIEVACHPVDIVLPPESGTVPVKLLLTPRQVGQLNIIGYTTQVMGVKSPCRLREISHLSSGIYTTKVVPALPMLHVTTSLPKMESFSTMADGDCVVASGSLCLCAGQSSSFEVKLQNVGKIPVERLEVILSSSVQQDVLKRLVVWDEVGFKKQLPLQPGCTSCISFTVHGLSNFLSPAEVHDSCAGSFDTEQSFWDSLLSFMDTRDTSGTVTVELLMLMQYSGGSSGGGSCDQRFCRQCSVSLALDVQPSVYIRRWQIVPSLSNDDCSLELDVENASPVDIALRVPQQKLLIASHQTDRLSLCLPRTNAVPSSLLLNNRCDPSSQQDTDLEAEMIIQKHICTHFNIQWTMPSSGASGQVSLEGIRWTKSQCASLLILPISWAIAVDGERVDPGSVVARQASSPLSVQVTVVNCSDSELADVRLCVHPCQDVGLFLDDHESLSREQQVAVMIGSSEALLTKVPAGASVNHSCSFFFPWSGAYQLLCICEATLTESNVLKESERQIWRRSVEVKLYNAPTTTI